MRYAHDQIKNNNILYSVKPNYPKIIFFFFLKYDVLFYNCTSLPKIHVVPNFWSVKFKFNSTLITKQLFFGVI